MRPAQSSLYREIQSLHIWCLNACSNLPNNAVLHEEVRILVEKLVEAETACALAVLTSDMARRLQYLDVVELDILNVQTSTKVLYEYSVSNPKNTRVFSIKQRADLLDKMHSIGKQLNSWRNSTQAKINTASK